MGREKLLAYITGSVDEELLLRNEYLLAENRILRRQIEGRLRLTDEDRRSLSDIGKRLGKQALEEVANLVKPETILGCHRQQVAKKCDGSRQRKAPGRPKVDPALETLVSRMARTTARLRGFLRCAQTASRLCLHGRIGARAMTVSSVRWRSWVIRSTTKRSAIF